ncbi:4729_t:CDS:2 [Ambispora gerdemannii]|uniref:4729_t:CDS:1 n=1 Tax=Ambispora gerdemannii TaxID=144530 RepID=A0A9N8YKB7_9GLOM|nr:4729_t:CDS:2 [Ambispora gerdemannii]
MTTDNNQQPLLNYCKKYIPEPHITKWFNIISNGYSEPHRYYHGLNHITRIIVYDPKKFNNNEEQSIKLFDEYAQEVELTATERDHVSLFIAATIHHELPLFTITNNRDGDDDDCELDIKEDLKLFLDLDLEVLSWEPDEYDKYAKQIRQEYIHYSTEDFSIGRAKVLEKFLARDNLYLSRVFLEERGGCEMDARNNLIREIRESLPPRSPSPSFPSSSSFGNNHRSRIAGYTTYQSNPLMQLRPGSQTTIDCPSTLPLTSIQTSSTYSNIRGISSFDNFESNKKAVRSKSPESFILSGTIPTLPNNSQQSNRRRSLSLYYPPPSEYHPQVTREQELSRYTHVNSSKINNAIPLSKRSLTGYAKLTSRDSVSYENQPKLCKFCQEGEDCVGEKITIKGSKYITKGRLFSTCKCNGPMKYVHVGCLELWRNTGIRQEASYRCEICEYEYKFYRTRIAKILSSWILAHFLSILTLLGLFFAFSWMTKIFDHTIRNEKSDLNDTYFIHRKIEFLNLANWNWIAGLLAISIIGLLFLTYHSWRYGFRSTRELYFGGGGRICNCGHVSFILFIVFLVFGSVSGSYLLFQRFISWFMKRIEDVVLQVSKSQFRYT